MNLDTFKTRDKANTRTQKIFLVDPSNGKTTDQYVEVRSSLSDNFMAARDVAMQETQELGAIKTLSERKAASLRIRAKMAASLVAGWSFKEPATEEAVTDFLLNAPQIYNLVTESADTGAYFFGQPSTDSSAGQGQK
jgi:hypothetical protein